jgi:hypothetical protein
MAKNLLGRKGFDGSSQRMVFCDKAGAENMGQRPRKEGDFYESKENVEAVLESECP